MTRPRYSELCLHCGLCCHAFHNLGLVENNKEKKLVESFGGTVFLNQAGALSFRQPCPAFSEFCTVYEDRPESCQRYRCHLLELVQDENVDLDHAKEIVRSTKEEVESIDAGLIDLLGKRTVIVDEYIDLFFERTQNTGDRLYDHEELLLHFGMYKLLREKYFDTNSQ